MRARACSNWSRGALTMMLLVLASGVTITPAPPRRPNCWRTMRAISSASPSLSTTISMVRSAETLG